MRCEYGQLGDDSRLSIQLPHLGGIPRVLYDIGMTLNRVVGHKMAWIYALIYPENFRMWRDVEITVFLDFKLSP